MPLVRSQIINLLEQGVIPPDKIDDAAGKVALLMATIFLGVLRALFGQTYQTGADP